VTNGIEERSYRWARALVFALTVAVIVLLLLWWFLAA
jgi:hypothetical protein